MTATPASNLEIIETYWNVNIRFLLQSCHLPFEIIETYWNVNSKVMENEIGKWLPEIIETYWNVNVFDKGITIIEYARNNRNILECKCFNK